MEVDHLRKTGQGCVIQEEKRDELSNHDEDHCKEEVVLKDEKLELAKAEMGEVREENRRLRLYLDQIMRDYQILQKKFQDTMKNRAATNSINHQEMEEPDQLVSLSLGRTLSSDLKKDIDRRSKTPTTTHEEDNLKEGLALGLDCKFEVSSTTQAESSVNLSPENSLEEAKEEAGDQTWPPQKNLKTKRSGDDDHEVAPQTPAKKTRVSVRVRCDTPTMNDGCQWRKYGQKIAKGNPCPRAYYRCTVSPSCPVRKQVQRCAQDMSILITTYEGTHNHPLPISATAMASTTSAAASMLSSGSSTSVSNPNPLAAGTNSELHGMNFYLSENSKLKPFYLPYSSVSPSPSCPTITLDLTSNTVSSSSPFNRSSMPTNFPQRFSTTNLNFKPLESSALPISWSNGVLAGYSGAQAQPYDCKNQIGSLNFGIRQPQENFYQSYMQKNMANAITATPIQQSLQPDTIEAATKAITSDPNFQLALQAALTSIIGGGDKIDQNRNNLSDLFPLFSSFPSTSNANK